MLWCCGIVGVAETLSEDAAAAGLRCALRRCARRGVAPRGAMRGGGLNAPAGRTTLLIRVLPVRLASGNVHAVRNLRRTGRNCSADVRHGAQLVDRRDGRDKRRADYRKLV
jgi:hypothetical protein